MERPNAITLRDKPLTLIGPELKAGDRAPDFTLTDHSWTPVTLAATGDRLRVFSVVPSLDTSVCTLQTKRFSEEAAKLGDKVAFYSISRDLPFAAKRWCGAEGVSNVTTLSDHVDGHFGRNYGVFIKEMALNARSVFVIDAKGVIRYAEYVKVFGEQPNYDAVLTAVKGLL
jgi:thiol peroxidase